MPLIRQNEPSSKQRCSQILLFIFSGIFLIGSIPFAAIGGIGLYISLTYRNSGNQVNDDQSKSLDSTIFLVSVIVLLIGGFFIFTCLLGFFGAFLKSRGCLIIYAAMVTILFIGQIVFIVYLVKEVLTIKQMGSDVFDQTEDYLYREFKQYTGEDHTTENKFFNTMFTEFDCCGIKGYEDFKTRSSWPGRTPYGTIIYEQVVPVQCCKEDYRGEHMLYYDPRDTCTLNPNEFNSNYKKGCLGDGILSTIGVDDIALVSYILIGLSAAGCIIEIICLISAYFVCRRNKPTESMMLDSRYYDEQL